jgi:UDP-glucose:(heptosyl)LPS alpha-1,3-glucosyltransferase
VRFLGSVDRVADLYLAADFFLFPTFYDPGSLVVAEAMYFGLPVVTTRQNGASEMMTDGEHGFILPHAWDLPALTAAVDRLVSHPALRLQMGRAAAGHIARFTLDAMHDRLWHALLTAARDPAADPRCRYPTTTAGDLSNRPT